MSTTSMAIFSNPLFVTYSVYARNASIDLHTCSVDILLTWHKKLTEAVCAMCGCCSSLASRHDSFGILSPWLTGHFVRTGNYWERSSRRRQTFTSSWLCRVKNSSKTFRSMCWNNIKHTRRWLSHLSLCIVCYLVWRTQEAGLQSPCLASQRTRGVQHGWMWSSQ